MTILSRSIMSVAMIAVLGTLGSAQNADVTRSSGARIAGTVTVDGNPTSGVELLLYLPDNKNSDTSFTYSTGRRIGELKGRAVSGSDGNYAFNSLTAGSYIVFPFGPALSAPSSGGFLAPGKSVSTDQGESINDLNFGLSSGGVVTGRVMRPDGQPAVDVEVLVQNQDHGRPGLDTSTGSFPADVRTDDRGVYRAFGLSPGRYLVSTEQRLGLSPSRITLVYYSGAIDKAQAAIVNVAGGQECDNIDITLAKPAATSEAAGQALDASTGSPIAGVQYSCYSVSENGLPNGWYGENQTDVTDAAGQFQIRGLTSGHYAISLKFDPSQGLSSDPAIFTVSDGNVSGIQVKVHAAATLSGVVTIQGNQDPRVLSQLSALTIQAISGGAPGALLSSQFFSPASDGSFQLSGASPGNLSFSLDRSMSQGFSILQIERDGAPQPNAIAIGAGEQVTGVQIVLVYGTASLRGQVTFQGGQLPAGTVVALSAQLISGSRPITVQQTAADARGRFQIDNLPDGQYQLSVRWYGSSAIGEQPGPIVNVSGGQAPDANVVINLNNSQ